MDNIKRAACAGVAVSVAAPYVAGMADGKLPNSEPMKAAALTITFLTSGGHSTLAADGSVFTPNAITGNDIRAFAPAIRKPTTVQST
jgi:hypothetical protein